VYTPPFCGPDHHGEKWRGSVRSAGIELRWDHPSCGEVGASPDAPARLEGSLGGSQSSVADARANVRGVQPLDTTLQVRPLRRSEYDRLVALGLFEDERLELLDGRLVLMSPQGHAHAFSVRKLNTFLVPQLAGRAEVQVQGPIAASDDSEPEPDLAVVEPGDYLDDHPRSAHLVIEVADSSRPTDLGTKARLYAAMSVPEYWVVDVSRGEIVVHRDPADDRYREIRTLGPDAELALLRFPDVRVRAADVLPRR
jgi:Uma2 family endonuclease